MYDEDNGVPHGLSLVARITIKAGDPEMNVLFRCMKSSERPSMAIRRALLRFGQVIGETIPPPPDVVSIVSSATATSRVGFLHSLQYPPKDVVARAIRESTVTAEQRQIALSYLERCTFAEYARLIEAVELM